MQRNLDQKIWMCTLAIIALGLAALYSASFQNSRVPQSVFTNQAVCALAGILVMFFFSKMDYRRFYDAAYLFYILNILILLFVLLGGHTALGARRWMDLGLFNFQPSELTKLSLILMLGRYFSNRRPTLSFNLLSKVHVVSRDLIWPLILTGIPMLLIFKQPDLGTALLLFGIFLVMLFVTGLELKYILGLLGVILCFLPFAWHFLKDYQKDRLLVFLNPDIDPLGAGYTIIQSKIAVGSGGIFGKGWLAGTQNQLNFLPERHTDFIFSVIGEEWGFVGSAVLILCYFGLIGYSLDIAQQVRDKFGTLVTVGIISIFALQVIINIGMVVGLFPIVGLTLPFVSYGRSSFLIFSVMLGFLLNLSRRRTIF